MRKVLCLLMLIAAASVHAKQEITRLQCDGEYSNFVTGVKDIADTGGYVEVQKSRVKVVSVLGFERTYIVNLTNESRICFVASDDKNMQGCLNRFTGNLSLYQRVNQSDRLDQLWSGKCSPARPLFQ
jgi:hypothetical protein